MDITALNPTQANPTTGAVSVSAQETQKGQGTSQEGKAKGTSDTLQLSPEAQAKVASLKARDAAVRAHEAAHLSAAGGLAQGGATFTYAQGPDGKRYAVGGEVSIDSSGVKDDPAATMAKARQIRAAALAPADPSPQDQKVAAAATQMEAQAASDLARQSQATPQGRTASAAYRSTAGNDRQKAPSLDVVA
ncbi:MAG: hypothetical protein H6Q00_3564 [Holophagaceae bacterium]|nr:hypothetical protein [Holophagaceae bacterium]